MKIDIHQIYYQHDQLDALDASFHQHFNSLNPRPEWREYWVFREAFQSKTYLSSDYSGYLSWKFSQKTGISGAEFLHFIETSPGFDVYFINPFPSTCVFFRNVWQDGEEHHPGILNFTQKVFDDLGYKINLAEIQNYSDTTLFCNYWVGNKVFWERFMAFTEPIFDYLENRLTPAQKSFINSRADGVISSSYRAFIMERLFSTFLVYDRSVKGLPYRYSESQLKMKYPKIASVLVTAFKQEADLLSAPSVQKTDLYEQRRLFLNRRFIFRPIPRKLLYGKIIPVVNKLHLNGPAVFVYRKFRSVWSFFKFS